MCNNKNKGSPNVAIRSIGSANTLKNDRVMLRSMFIGIAVNGKPLINNMRAIHARNITAAPSCHSPPLEQKQLLVLVLAMKENVRNDTQMSR